MKRLQIATVSGGHGLGARGLRVRSLRSSRSGIAATLALALIGYLAAGCGGDSPLTNAARSDEALIHAVLDALEARDEAALRGLLLTRDEYEGLLWPEMPDGEYMPFEFVWSLTSTNNRKGLRQALSSYGGLSLELVSMSFEEEPEIYQSFVIRPGARVMVRRTDTGEVGLLPTFDVFVEYGGGWKLMNYDEV